MQPKSIFNFFLPRALFILAIIGLFLAYQRREAIKDFSSTHLEKIQNYFAPSSEPLRRRPLSLLERETNLRLYVGEPFQGFSAADWDNFWNIIYGVFPKEPAEIPFLPKKTRQLTLQEIMEELRLFYPEPFNYFQEEHWQSFFGLVLK